MVTPTTSAHDAALHEGMEDLIAAMKDRRPAPSPAPDSTSLASEITTNGDHALADAPWSAVGACTAGSARPLEQGSVIGRYVVLRRLGAGAMGIVYAAYDPELDRKVALKLLLPGVGGPSGGTRLLREAQTLAKLAHPNVVAIHDVGAMGEQVWLAMEFVRGQTLRAWLATPRRWSEVVEVMRSAGEGLAAAHGAGLLHRDFKPDNVMIGDDGRVRVMDFGLARLQSSATKLEPESSTVAPNLDALALEVTRAGAVVGTPSYMAPEQFDGAELSAATDQFAFCVTLWEALFGERPFTGRSWQALAVSVFAGKLRPPPKGRRVPAWLQRACERGLAADPRQRWPTMQALLDTLATGRTRARIRQGLVALVAMALLAAGVEGHRRLDLARRIAACEAEGHEIETAWSPAREQAVRDGLAATGLSYATTTADKTVPWLERQAEAWREARVHACLDTFVRDRWDTDMLDRSLWCLEERRVQLEILGNALASATSETVPLSISLASSLLSVEPCRDPSTLEAPPAREHRDAIASVRRDILRADGLERLGRFDEASELAEATLARAEALSSPSLSVAALYQVGSLAFQTGDYAEAERTMEQVYFDASGGVAPGVAATAAADLVEIVGSRLARPDDGRRWGRHAALALAHAPDHEGLKRARLSFVLGNLALSSGDLEQAAELHERALTMRQSVLGDAHPVVGVSLSRVAAVKYHMGVYDESAALQQRAHDLMIETHGPDHPDLAASLTNMAATPYATGDYATARRLLERAIAIQEHAVGTGHPSVAMLHGNLGKILYKAGRHEDAKLHFERALAIRGRVFAPDHPSIADTLSDLSTAYESTGDPARAMALLERSLAIYERRGMLEHPDAAIQLTNLGNLHHQRGDLEQAKALHERALALVESGFGAEHATHAWILTSLANAHAAMGERDRADELYTRSLALGEKALGAEHPDLARTLVAIATLALDGGRPADGLRAAERAIAVCATQCADVQLAAARFVLARCRWEAPVGEGRDHARAVMLAAQARDGYRSAGTREAAKIAEIETWLARHRD